MILFEPEEETPEGWRATLLGRVACWIGWHFGQICVSPVQLRKRVLICAKCKRRYVRWDD